MSKTNKFIIWCVLVAITSFWMWATARIWLSAPLFEGNYTQFFIFSAVLTVLISILSLGFIFFKGKKEGIALSGIVGLMYFIMFGVSNFNLVGVTILILLFIHADDLVSSEILERIKINSKVLIRKSLPNIVLGLFILISFAAYESPAIESFQDIQKLPSSSEIFIKTVVEQTLSGQLVEATPQQKELVLSQVTQELISQANSFLEPYFQYAPPALAFGLFLILWSVGWIFMLLSVFLGVIMFWVLRKTNFIKIEDYDVKAQKLTI